MRISKELRIGLLVTISVLVFFAGFYFLKGSNLFSSDKIYYCFYDNVQGLQPSAAIQIRGLQVGKVEAIELNPNGKGVKVTLAIKKKYELPRGTVAQLFSGDLLGSKAIRLDLAAMGGGIVESGETLPSNIEGGMLDQISTEISPLLKSVQSVAFHTDSLLLSVNAILNENARQKLSTAVSELEGTMNHFQNVSATLDSRSAAIGRIIDNADRLAARLSANSGNIDSILNNANALTAQLKNAPIEQTVNDLQAASNQLQEVMGKINRGEGTMGAIVNDKELYQNLNTTVSELSKLAADLKAHPSRYINVTIFGRKAKVGN